VKPEVFRKLSIINTFLQEKCVEEHRLHTPIFRYGFLALILAWNVMELLSAIHSSPPYRHSKYFGLIFPMMMLFQHLAFNFYWSRPVRIALRICAFVSLVFGVLAMIFYDVFR